MNTNCTDSGRSRAATPRTRARALYLGLCAMGLSVCAGAQGAAPASNSKEVTLHKLVNPLRGIHHPAAVMRESASAQEATPAQSTKEVVLYNFKSPPHGAYPATGVIRDFEGNLYGTTNGSYSDIGGGGTNDAGVVFKIDPSGRETVLYSFTGGADGSSPNGLIRDSAGNLYGTTSGGGASGAGVVFKVDPSGNQTVLYSFTGGTDGGTPNNVVRDREGNLYGTTSSGGALGYGVVFKVDPSGHETVLYTFTGGTDGAYPNLPATLDSAGNFYGTTNNGGNQVGSAGAGVVFKVDPSGHETVLYAFTGGNDGAQPNGVIRGLKGDLYGTTSNGGAYGAGVVYQVDPSGHETVLYAFTGGNDGGFSSSGLTRDQAGNLFGTTDGGGTANAGVVFKVDPSGNETVLHTFTRGPYGNQPDLAGVILDADGNLYGTTAFSAAGGAGAVYKLDRFGNATVVYAFPGTARGQYPYNAGVILGSDGHLYGTTFYGGRRGAGVLYQLDEKGRDEKDLDEKGHETVLYAFDLFTANGFGQPTGGVIRDAAGKVYGTTFIGQADVGFGYGVVFRVDADGHAAVLHNFTDGADGGNPYGGVILDSKGNVYGTASGGGESNNGAVFKIDTSGNETVLYSFTGGADGGAPFGSLIRDSAGNLYGTTNGGGASGAGVVFKVDPSGHETVLYTFTGANDGGFPAWVTLARDSAGNLYGTTVAGGTANAGVVFKVDPSGNETVLHSFTGGADGGNPYAGVILGTEGQLYGTTPFGGESNVGVVFEIKP